MATDLPNGKGCDSHSDLPVPSLRHRFGLNRPAASPSSDLTPTPSSSVPFECTEEFNIVPHPEIPSTLKNMGRVKRHSPEGDADPSSFETDLTATDLPNGKGCDSHSDLPVPSLRHRFGLNRPTASPSPDLTPTPSSSVPFECTEEFNIVPHPEIPSTLKNMGRVKRHSPEGDADPSSFETDLTVSEQYTETCSAIMKPEILLSRGDISVVTPRLSVLLNEPFQDDGIRSTLEGPIPSKMEETILKWDYAGDLASQNLSADSVHHVRTCNDGDHGSADKESLEDEAVTVPLTWPSPFNSHRSPRLHAVLVGRKLRSGYRYSAVDQQHVPGLSKLFPKGMWYEFFL
ncbi:unnamed protein product [Echinostoma caproni]|uniref:Protein RUBCNL-like n=1 Tax=Echinostoma caproni TaxID=27848 RepID=A0A183B7X7_9TREM|nr:unnamed protein product [Echinostoma caproni]